MSLTSWPWMRQMATSSGRTVSQPSGPGGRASEPAVIAALLAALLASRRHSSSTVPLLARGMSLSGMRLTNSRIAFATGLSPRSAATGTISVDVGAGSRFAIVVDSVGRGADIVAAVT